MTLDSPISSLPILCKSATPRTPGQRARTAEAISRILAAAMGACASYSRNFTRRPPVSSRTTPEKSTSPPAPGSPTAAITRSSESGAAVTSMRSVEAPPLTGGKRQTSSPARRRWVEET